MKSTTTTISADGRYILLGTAQGELQVYDQTQNTPLEPVKAHSGDISLMLFSPDQKTIVSAGHDGLLKKWQ